MANYILPPWLHPSRTDPAQAFVSAFQTGAQVANQRARLAQHAEQVAMDAAIKDREVQRRAALDQQRVEIAKARTQAEIGIREQQLNVVQERARDTARMAAANFKLRAMQDQREDAKIGMVQEKQARSVAAQNEAQRRIAAGEDATKVYMELGPAIQGGMTGMSGFINQGSGIDFTKEQARPVAGLPDRYKALRTGKNTQQVFDTGSTQEPEARPLKGDPSKVVIDMGNGKPPIVRNAPVSPEMEALGKALAAAYSDDDPEAVARIRKQIADLNNAAPAAPSTNSIRILRMGPKKE